ncbi:MAG: photosynthetic reaction center cytochrome c subunit family protein [Terriglobales bacterium]
MRLLTVRSFLVGLTLISVAGLAAAQQTPAEKTAEQVFKNIQVFQGKPANELIPTMQFIASSLGVHCSYCHEENRSLDTKPEKKRARQMVEMVYAINKSTFGGRNEVNCYTCHQGSPHPNGRLALASLTGAPAGGPGRGGPGSAGPGGEGGGQGAASRPKLPGAQEILDKYMAAIGGASSLQAIHAETVKGERMAFGRSTPVELTRAGGKLLLTEGTNAKSGFDGTTFWSWGRRGTDMNPESSTVAQLRTDLPLYPGAGIDASKARVFTEQDIDGQKAYILGVRTASGFDSYAFDASSGLLMRMTTGAPTFLGTLPLQVDYNDWRQVGSVKLPFDVVFDTHEFHWERKINDIRLNPSVDAARFTAPAAAPSGASN